MKNFIYSLIFSLLTIPFYAQEDSYSSGKQYVVTRHDGEYIGEIISDDGREILIITKSIGKLYIRKSLISSIKLIDGEISYDEDYKTSGPLPPDTILTMRFQLKK